MNLHDIGRTLRGMRFGGHSALAWGSIVRRAQGKSHLYEMPVHNGWLATTVYAALYDDVEPLPACGQKPRRGATPFQYVYGEKTWNNWCRECEAIAQNEGLQLTRSHWWRRVATEDELNAFLQNAETHPR